MKEGNDGRRGMNWPCPMVAQRGLMSPLSPFHDVSMLYSILLRPGLHEKSLS